MLAALNDDDHKWYRVILAALHAQRGSRLGAGWYDDAQVLIQHGAQITRVDDTIFQLIDALDAHACDVIVAHALPAHILTSEKMMLRAVGALRPFVFESMIAQGVRFREPGRQADRDDRDDQDDQDLVLLRAVQRPRIMMALEQWNHNLYSRRALEIKAIDAVVSHNLLMLHYLINRYPVLVEEATILDELVAKSIAVNNLPIFRTLMQFLTLSGESTFSTETIFMRTRYRAEIFGYVVNLLPEAVPKFIEMQICERGDVDAMSVLARAYPHLVTHQLLHFAEMCCQPAMAQLLENILRERDQGVQRDETVAYPDQTALSQAKAARLEKIVAKGGPGILKAYASIIHLVKIGKDPSLTPSKIPVLVKLATVKDDTELIIYLMDQFPEPFQSLPVTLLNILTPSRLIDVLRHYLRVFPQKKASLQAIRLARWPCDATLELFLLQNEVIVDKKMVELAKRTRGEAVLEFVLDNYSGDEDIVSNRFVRKAIEGNKAHIFRVLLQRGLLRPGSSTQREASWVSWGSWASWAIRSGAAAVLLVLVTRPALLSKEDLADILKEIAKFGGIDVLEVVLSRRFMDLTTAMLLKAAETACFYGNTTVMERLTDTLLIRGCQGKGLQQVSDQLAGAAARAGRREILIRLIRKYGWHADERDIAIGRAKGLIARDQD